MLKYIASSYINVRDDSMSVIPFFTMSKGKLPHLSYIFRNPEPLGTELNIFDFSVTGALIFLEIQWDKEGVKLTQYYLELGDTSACTSILMEHMKGLG